MSIQAPKPTVKPHFESHEDDNEPARPVPEIEDTMDANSQSLNQLPTYDRLLNVEVQMQLGEEHAVGKVKK